MAFLLFCSHTGTSIHYPRSFSESPVRIRHFNISLTGVFLLRDLVDLVNKYDAPHALTSLSLRQGSLEARSRNISPDMARLGREVASAMAKGHIEKPSKGLYQINLAMEPVGPIMSMLDFSISISSIVLVSTTTCQ